MKTLPWTSAVIQYSILSPLNVYSVYCTHDVQCMNIHRLFKVIGHFWSDSSSGSSSFCFIFLNSSSLDHKGISYLSRILLRLHLRHRQNNAILVVMMFFWIFLFSILYSRIQWFRNFAILHVDLECGKNSKIKLKIRFSLFWAVSCENGFFGAKKVKDSLYEVINFFSQKRPI
jgi:hypothetical protein